MKVVGNVLARTRARTFISTVINGGCPTGEGTGRGEESPRTAGSSRRGAGPNPAATGPTTLGPEGRGTYQPSLRPPLDVPFHCPRVIVSFSWRWREEEPRACGVTTATLGGGGSSPVTGC